MLTYFQNLILPVFFFIILATGLVKKVKVYDEFLAGAKDGLKTTVSIVAPLIGLMAAIGMFRASGALDLISFGLKPVCDFLGIPQEVVPLALMRPISGSASLAIVTDTISRYGPDTLVGRVTSVMMGSTETTFYTICVYFAATKAKDTRYTLKCALLADLVGILVSCWICQIL